MDIFGVYETALGPLTIVCTPEGISAIRFGGRLGEGNPSPLTDQAAEQLREYLAGTRKAFDLPLAPAGTEFQRKVWAALREIPYGEKRTYGEIATAVGNPRACRAVGMANNRNPLPIVVPCHRVIGANGTLTGYAGGLERKAQLLMLEGAL